MHPVGPHWPLLAVSTYDKRLLIRLAVQGMAPLAIRADAGGEMLWQQANSNHDQSISMSCHLAPSSWLETRGLHPRILL